MCRAEFWQEAVHSVPQCRQPWMSRWTRVSILLSRIQLQDRVDRAHRLCLARLTVAVDFDVGDLQDVEAVFENVV